MTTSTNSKSMALDFRFFSWKSKAPHMKLTITELRRTMETMEIMAAGRRKA